MTGPLLFSDLHFTKNEGLFITCKSMLNKYRATVFFNLRQKVRIRAI